MRLAFGAKNRCGQHEPVQKGVPHRKRCAIIIFKRAPVLKRESAARAYLYKARAYTSHSGKGGLGDGTCKRNCSLCRPCGGHGTPAAPYPDRPWAGATCRNLTGMSIIKSMAILH